MIIHSCFRTGPELKKNARMLLRECQKSLRAWSDRSLWGHPMVLLFPTRARTNWSAWETIYNYNRTIFYVFCGYQEQFLGLSRTIFYKNSQ